MKINTVLKKFFDISAANISRLEGYDSTNYKVESKKGIFVLKQNAFSKESFALLQVENQVLKKLEGLDNFDTTKVFPSLQHNLITVVDNEMFRLLSFVEGVFLGDAPHTFALLHSFGTFLAKMDKQIHSEYQSAINGKVTQWDLRHFPKNYRFLDYIKEAKDRNLVDYFFLQFEENIAPIQYKLRKAIIHNDANDWNVLTQNEHVSGIIDFGDMCHSWLINEVAVAITYVMMGKDRPLETASEVIKGYHEVFPLEQLELDILYYLVAARLCTSVCNSAYSKTMKPNSDYITISEKPAWEPLRKWLTINPVKAKDAFRKAAAFPPSPKPSLKNQIKRRKRNLSGALSLSYDEPLQMYRSAFQFMYDTDGNTILDAYNNIMLAGHCHPKVVRAGQRTMARLNTNTRYVYDEILSYSDKLLSKFPAKLNKVFFVNSGSAASDLAIRMAMTHTKKERVMVLEHGYHGNTRIGVDISHYKYNHKGGTGRRDYILETPMPKVFGSGYSDDGTAAHYYAERTVAQINEYQHEIAAFIAEPIVGCGGQVPLANGFLKAIYPEIRKQGGLCISDEVQVGFGRLGDYFWGFEQHGVEPDLVIIGKPIGNGHPIGAVVTTTEVSQSFDNGLEFFSSFGGNPVSCAIGQAVIEVIEEEQLQEHAKVVGNHLIKALTSLQKKYSEIADVRGAGLFLGVEITDKQGTPNTVLADQIKNGLRERNILVSTDGPYDNVLKIKPPLSFNIKNATTLIAAIDEILSDKV